MRARSLSAFFIFLTLCSVMPSQDALAAFKSASDAMGAEASFNPAPAPDDIELPMPCGQKMILRGVDIPGHILPDRNISMGIASVGDTDRQIYERRFTGHISAPLTEEDLPKAWRGRLSGHSAEASTWYFIGKYEVSQKQWLSVMDALSADGQENVDACPAKNMSGGNLPVTGISWFGVQDFIFRYNTWLLKNHPDSLPVFKNSRIHAYLRLPSEAEWEYAARGGAAVPPEWWQENDIFPMPKDRSLQDYGVFNSGIARNAPAPIGTRQPNPLGIHDVLGNAREMVADFFRLSVADMQNGLVGRRLHGSAGGIVTKGGGFRSDENSVLPGWREELPLFTAKGAAHAADLGFRLALSAPTVPDAQRLEQLRNLSKQLQTSEETPRITAADYDDPLEALAAIAKVADPATGKELANIQARLEERENARATHDSRELERAVRSLLYQAETLRAFAFRYVEVQKEKNAASAILDRHPAEAERKKAQELESMLKQYLDDYLQSLQMGASHYISGLAALGQEKKEALAELYARCRREYGGEGIFNEHMRQNLASLEKFMAEIRTHGLESLDQKDVLQGIIPERHFKAIQF